jgi:hypothetical protein
MAFCHHRESIFSKGYSSTKKPLKQLDREDILAFPDSLRKSETADPLHKWIGTYNLYKTHLMRWSMRSFKLSILVSM